MAPTFVFVLQQLERMDTKYWVQTKEETAIPNRFWERTEWMAGDRPPFSEYLDELEAPIAQEAGVEAKSFWIGWDAEQTHQVIVDPLSLYQMGEKGIGLGIQHLTNSNEPPTHFLPKGEVIDLWVEMNQQEGLMTPFLYVAFEDRSLWKSSVSKLRRLKPCGKNRPGVLLVQSVTLVDLYHLVEELLYNAQFGKYFRSYEAELGLSNPKLGFGLAWRCQESIGIPTPLIEEMSQLGWQIFPYQRGWKAQKEWPCGVPTDKALRTMLQQWPEIWSALRHHGLAKRDLCLQLTTASLSDCFIPAAILRNMAQYGLQLEVCD